ncbi:protein-disulfide reductase DsbD domain-containing protein [Falsirhodobacter halotolerans]|uniref:protein-disulfide reductase DsbD domain-containing protein n=1 Tax=Falsirhodobacter halotolerans TaxID=1146892 RepID=UPI001FCFD062|nr:protein-disulfide reductase DsbD domain-containing protein [Falsirhodobacter halotolerans]MCJ8138816.1 hypothetical protein [Falsirhodobacter halotolerans]
MLIRALIAPFLLASLVAAPALAAPPPVAGEILPGWQEPDGARMVAVRLSLAQGWKTYWRSPGDAGIPPDFDWSGSQNVKSVRLHWPTPSIFRTNGMRTIGYHDELILPVEVVPQDPARPIRLNAELDMGVCRDVCIPATVDLRADLSGQGAPDARIQTALAHRPATAREARLANLTCTVTPIDDGLAITARMTLPAQGGTELVVIEPANPAIWVSETRTTRQGSTLTATADMVGPTNAPFALDRSSLTVSVLGDGHSVETRGCPSN